MSLLGVNTPDNDIFSIFRKHLFPIMNLVQYDGTRCYIKVPVSLKAYQFYVSKYGAEIETSSKKSSFWGSLSSILLEKNQYGRMTVKRIQPLKKLTLLIPIRYKATSLNQETLNRLTNLLEQNMREHLVTWVASGYMSGLSESQSTENFFNHYKIRDGDVDAGRMIYRRSKEFGENNKKRMSEAFC